MSRTKPIRVAVRVFPNARRRAVEALPDGLLRVAVRAPAREGQANQAVVEALADHFRVPRSRVRIVHGLHARLKLVEIDT